MRSGRLRRAWRALALAGAALAASCAPPPAPAPSAGSACAPFRLLKPARVLAAPRPGGAVLRELPAGGAVFLCGSRGGPVRAMFPAPGERADCLSRTGPACPAGWIAIDEAAFDATFEPAG